MSQREQLFAVTPASDPASSPAPAFNPEVGEEEAFWFVAVDRRGQVVDRINVSERSGGWHEAALWCWLAYKRSDERHAAQQADA